MATRCAPGSLRAASKASTAAALRCSMRSPTRAPAPPPPKSSAPGPAEPPPGPEAESKAWAYARRCAAARSRRLRARPRGSSTPESWGRVRDQDQSRISSESSGQGTVHEIALRSCCQAGGPRRARPALKAAPRMAPSRTMRATSAIAVPETAAAGSSGGSCSTGTSATREKRGADPYGSASSWCASAMLDAMRLCAGAGCMRVRRRRSFSPTLARFRALVMSSKSTTSASAVSCMIAL
mmetsp:Transcript_9291/g.27560  ORF Transcript_9291/g.27560 Transcript_9291/m.27560 type:complete len:239 (+) Transcript_9291:154-870(+)